MPLELGRHVAWGLEHLHEHGVFHCDIKPRNLLWTGRGTKIIDFNVSVAAKDEERRGGGSRRYLPPDLDLEAIPSASDLTDRDLYALGLTLYEAVTGRVPVGCPGPAAWQATRATHASFQTSATSRPSSWTSC